MTDDQLNARFDRLERLLAKPTDNTKQILGLCVRRLKYPSINNFKSSKEIFDRIGHLLKIDSPSGVSRLLVNNGYTKATRMIAGKSVRGFYLGFSPVMPTSEELEALGE